MSEVEWKDVVGYEGLYEVSDTGVVRSNLRILYYKDALHVHSSKVLKPDENRSYKNKDRVTSLRVTLSKDNIQRRFMVHQLVMGAFIGPCPKGMEIAHNDGNPYNNRPENLRYTSHSDNEMDKIEHGSMRYGRVHHNHKNIYKVTDPEGNSHVIESPQLFFRERMPEMEARRFSKRVCDSSRIKRKKGAYKGWTLKEVVDYS